MTEPPVTVIIPTHNRWPLVADAVESVLRQNYVNTQCLVVDDDSTDGTVEKLQQRFGDAIWVLRNETVREKSYNRNRGVREAGSEFVCFLDSDDLLLPNAVADRMALYTDDPAFNGVAFGYTVAEGEESQAPSAPTSFTLETYLKDKAGLRTNSFLLRRDTMLSTGMYSENLTNREDIELFIRLLSQLEFRCCGTVVSVYRKSAPSRARDDWRKIIRQGMALTDTLAADPQVMEALGEHYQALRREEYGELLRALYRSRRDADYMDYYQQARREKLGLSFRFRRRYLLVRLRRLVGIQPVY